MEPQEDDEFDDSIEVTPIELLAILATVAILLTAALDLSNNVILAAVIIAIPLWGLVVAERLKSD